MNLDVLEGNLFLQKDKEYSLHKGAEPAGV
jgi:hypothetical protein